MKNYVCTHCGGSNITFDANAVWSVLLQDYVLTGVMGNSVCEGCGGECAVKEMEAELPELLTEERLECMKRINTALKLLGIPSYSELRDALAKAEMALLHLEDHAPYTAMDRLRMAVAVYERIPKAEED